MFILPINKDVRCLRTPYVTYGLILVNSALWLVPSLLGINNQLIVNYGYRPGNPSVVTLFASMFLHSGFWHVAGNMWFLWMFAPKLEERLGSIGLLSSYLLAGVGAAGLHTLFSLHSTVPCIGASGAISGVVGIYFLLFPRSPFDLSLYLGWWRAKTFQTLTRGAVGAWIGEQLVLGLLTTATGAAIGGVAFWAHIGGFGTGLLWGGAVLALAKPEERTAALHPAPLTQEEKDEMFADREEQASGLTTLKLN
jgi:membrane associated rhomboid family serine protease